MTINTRSNTNVAGSFPTFGCVKSLLVIFRESKSIVQKMTIPPSIQETPLSVSRSHRYRANQWMLFCRSYVEAKRGLCQQIVAILEGHPDNPRPLPQNVPYTEIHIRETISSLESLHFDDSDIPLVPEESLTSTCCTPTQPPAALSSKAAAPPPPSKPFTFLKDKYRKIFNSIENKLKLVFPPMDDFINLRIYQVKELEYDFNVLEMQCDNVQRYFENTDVPTAILKRSALTLTRIFYETRFQYENVVDCNSKVNAKLKKYVHDKLAEGENAREEEDPRSDSPVARPSGWQNRPSAKTSKEDASSTTPQRRSTEVSASAPDGLQTPTSSKRTPKHSAKEDPHGKPPSKRTPAKHSEKEDSRGKRLGVGTSGVKSLLGSVQTLIRKNRGDKNAELSSDSTEETSRDTISAEVLDSVIDMAVTGSEDDGKKKVRSESPRKTGTKPKIASAKED